MCEVWGTVLGNGDPILLPGARGLQRPERADVGMTLQLMQEKRSLEGRIQSTLVPLEGQWD